MSLKKYEEIVLWFYYAFPLENLGKTPLVKFIWTMAMVSLFQFPHQISKYARELAKQDMPTTAAAWYDFVKQSNMQTAVYESLQIHEKRAMLTNIWKIWFFAKLLICLWRVPGQYACRPTHLGHSMQLQSSPSSRKKTADAPDEAKCSGNCNSCWNKVGAW